MLMDEWLVFGIGDVCKIKVYVIVLVEMLLMVCVLGDVDVLVDWLISICDCVEVIVVVDCFRCEEY